MNGGAWDAIVIGAGAAGMMCAAVAGQRGARVLLIEHAEKLGEKIRISGGGRCNFTNVSAGPANFISENAAFCRSALARYTAADFVGLVKRHRIRFHEKHKGQLFCDESSEQIIDLLVAECDAGRVRWMRPGKVERIGRSGERFEVSTDAGVQTAWRVVIATGGLSIPKIGATDFGYRIARQFGLRIVEPRPALVPLTFDAAQWASFAPLAGVSLEVDARCDGARFDEDLLFTHRGLSGPAILQISSFWEPGAEIELNLAPRFAGDALVDALLALKRDSRQTLANALAGLLPRRLAEGWLQSQSIDGRQRLPDVPDRALRALALSLRQWRLKPAGSEGYRKAEVTRGGVATDELSQASLEAKRVPGLHVIGEVVDVTGWLGGYNFQWAWSSGYAAGQAIGTHFAPHR
ncbi:MAG TPA: NAD(P)/FAD-dependent oxidoreductase [Burkholderiaceae bacterium]|nr:NAD(P)/FAD-dependent oxidoreductase [Burkholderiaceae bacterium]